LFAGEYQWGTWKSIIPRNRRLSLLMVKYVTLGVMTVLTFALMSVIALIGYLLIALVGGVSVEPALSGHVLADFIGDYATQAMLAFLSTLIIAGYTALIAMLTRSMVGGILVGVGAILVETLILPIALVIIGSILDIPSITKSITYLPVYNFSNISSWAVEGHSATMDLGDIMVARSLTFSIVVLAIWVFGLIGLTVAIFRRQDITS
jgi:ABC-type transport system involved in multi-copper enzyme maturation permease subunit